MATIDHLMWVVPDLGAGVDDLERRAGARATLGGSHPSMGTANAILGLGAGVYLEVLGPDPALEEPKGFGAAIAAEPAPRLELGRAHRRHRRGLRRADRRGLADDRQRDDTHAP